MSTKAKLWIAGLILALVGVILARVVSGKYVGDALVQLAVYFTGVTLALAGLVIIVASVRKK